MQFPVRREGRAVEDHDLQRVRTRYAETLNSVVEYREEVIVTRAGHDPVVIVALDDYQSLREAAYLLRSPANASRLLASIDCLENGGGSEHELAGP